MRYVLLEAFTCHQNSPLRLALPSYTKASTELSRLCGLDNRGVKLATACNQGCAFAGQAATTTRIRQITIYNDRRREIECLSAEQRRTKYDIYADVIEIVTRKNLCSLTRISYGANMPIDRTKKVLGFLVSRGFLHEVLVADSKKYRATKWGLEFLETYKRMRKFFAALEQ